jgi:hypothetical protein
MKTRALTSIDLYIKSCGSASSIGYPLLNRAICAAAPSHSLSQHSHYLIYGHKHSLTHAVSMTRPSEILGLIFYVGIITLSLGLWFPHQKTILRLFRLSLLHSSHHDGVVTIDRPFF